MMAELVIKNSRLVLPEGVVDAGLVIEAGKIRDILNDSALPDADNVVDAEGNYILPGMIDVHVHMREPGAVSKEGWVTGSKAASAGGVTTIFDMPNTQPPTTSMQELAKKRENVKGKSLVDYGFHFAATPDNQEELKKLTADIASVKFYTCSTVGSLLIDNDAAIFEDFRILEEKQLISTVHAENQVMIDYWMNALKESGEDITPLTYAQTRGNICASESLNSLIYLSKSAGSKLHVAHISTREEVNLVRKFKDPQLTAEVSPHHLFLSLDDVGRLGSYSKVNPPLRSEVDVCALWEGLFDGTIDMIASDHAPHLRESKERDIFTASAGFPELETTLPLLLNETHKGRLTLESIAKITAENPARVFRVKNKGRIEKGFDADLVIVDLDRERMVREEELFTKCAWSPYAGRNLKGWPVKTFVGGNLVFDEGIVYEEKKGKEVSYY